MPRTKFQPDRQYPNRVREFRMRANLTLKELAERSGLFFTQIGKIELGERPAKDFEFRAIAKALGVEAADLHNVDEGGLSDEERLMVGTYRELPADMKRMLRAMLESQQDARAPVEIVALETPVRDGKERKAG